MSIRWRRLDDVIRTGQDTMDSEQSNQIRHSIDDLSARVDALRGYL